MASLIARWQITVQRYPRSFWILFWGTLVHRSGVSMVWPFLTLFMRDRLDVPLATVTFLLTLESVSGMVSTSLAGMAVDRFGRKGAMLVSLVGGALVFIGMTVAQSLPFWMVLMVLRGILEPLYRVGSQTVVTDLVGEENRSGAFALIRMIANAGVAIGPAIGGFVLVISYIPIFLIAAAAMLSFAVLTLRAIPETLPPEVDRQTREFGYGRILKDRPFLLMSASYALVLMPYTLMMVLMPVYMEDNFGIRASYFAWMLTLNAVMVVFLQYGVTRFVETWFTVPAALTIGAGIVALTMLIMLASQGIILFTLAMVMLTVGEMIVMPTSNTYAANLAPLDMRGRYMSVYVLTWGLGHAVALTFGGILNDEIAPLAVWVGGLIMALLATAGFALLLRQQRKRPQPIAHVTAAAMD
jgi:MFS family permease